MENKMKLAYFIVDNEHKRSVVYLVTKTGMDCFFFFFNQCSDQFQFRKKNTQDFRC